MHWSDNAIVLSVRRLGENSGVVHLLTQEHGLHAGVDRGAFGSRKRGVYQPGNSVMANWQARLPEHMGNYTCELTQAATAHLLDDRRKLAALTSAVLLTEKMLAEREEQPAIYHYMKALVGALCADGDWPAEYVRLEYALLACTGFGLDLERCASTGQSHDLIYVSPRSGRAVSREAGEPYRDRLFKLPAFLVSPSLPLPQAGEADLLGEPQASLENPVRALQPALPSPNPLPQAGEGFPLSASTSGRNGHIHIAHILDGLRLCGHFLESRVFVPRGIPVPAVRGRFLMVLQDSGEAFA